MNLDELRLDFINRRNGCLSLPITGCIVWSLAAIAGFYVPRMNEKELIIRITFLVLGAVGFTLLAKRKNRRAWPWGAVGALCGAIAPLLLLPPLLVLGFVGEIPTEDDPSKAIRARTVANECLVGGIGV